MHYRCVESITTGEAIGLYIKTEFDTDTTT